MTAADDHVSSPRHSLRDRFKTGLANFGFVALALMVPIGGGLGMATAVNGAPATWNGPDGKATDQFEALPAEGDMVDGSGAQEWDFPAGSFGIGLGAALGEK